jgi:hypothetical protein
MNLILVHFLYSAVTTLSNNHFDQNHTPLGWVALFIDFNRNTGETFSPNGKCNHILANHSEVNSGYNNLVSYDQKILACQSNRNCSAYNEHTSQWDPYIPFPIQAWTINVGK